MKYEVVVYYDDMVDSVHTFNNKNEAIKGSTHFSILR